MLYKINNKKGDIKRKKGKILRRNIEASLEDPQQKAASLKRAQLLVERGSAFAYL